MKYLNLDYTVSTRIALAIIVANTGWALCAYRPTSVWDVIAFLVCIVVLICIEGLKTDWFPADQEPTNAGILFDLFVVLLAIGASMQYEQGDLSMVTDILLYFLAFGAGVYITINTYLLQSRGLNYIFFVFIVLAPIIARLYRVENEASIQLPGGILLFAVMLLCFAFNISFLLTKTKLTTFRVNSRADNLPFNYIVILVELVIITLECGLLCNEFATILVLWVAAAIIILATNRQKISVRLKKWTMILFSCCFVLGSFLMATQNSGKITYRLMGFINPNSMINNSEYQLTMESIRFLYANIKRSGPWGLGEYDVLHNRVTTCFTDHMFSKIIIENGWIFAFLIVLLIISLIYLMMTVNTNDSYLSTFCCASGCLMGIVLLLHISSDIGSFMQAGVPLPFISEGTSSTMVFSGMMGVSYGTIKQKGRHHAKKASARI